MKNETKTKKSGKPTETRDSSSAVESKGEKSFVIDGVLSEGQIAMIVGEPRGGKSYASIRIARDLSKGVNPFTKETQDPKTVFYFNLSESQQTQMFRCLACDLTVHTIKDLPLGLRPEEDYKKNTLFEWNPTVERYERTDLFDQLQSFVLEDNVQLLILDSIDVLGGMTADADRWDANVLTDALFELITSMKGKMAILLTYSTTHFHKERGAGKLLTSLRLACSLVLELEDTRDCPMTHLLKVQWADELTLQQISKVDRTELVIMNERIYFK